MIAAPTYAPLVCGCGYPWGALADWCCPACGGPWEPPPVPPFEPAAVASTTWSLWRYAAMLPTDGLAHPVRLGEGGTPLVPVELPGGPVLAKLEFLSASGSYKDRGTALVVSQLRAAGAATLVTDSSGNAAASLAAYAAAGGLRARVYLPVHATGAKKRQIVALGAELVEVPGPRAAAGAAARRDPLGVYAHHAWHPYVLAGLATCAWELWEQTGGRLPEVVVCPAGQGTLLLGLARGFASLRAAGLLAASPRLVAVQAAACAPLAAAWAGANGGEHPLAPGTPGSGSLPAVELPTRAEGIRIVDPVRKAQVLRAVRDSGGAVFTVTDPQIEAAERDLAGVGVLVEPTSATAVAALPQVRQAWGGNVSIVVPLTGSGLKAMATPPGGGPC